MASLGRGITNAQASYLAALCRELKRPYFGSGLTQLQASEAIAELKRELEQRGKAGAQTRPDARSAAPS